MKPRDIEFAVRVTDRCNLNCAYCYARTADPGHMSLETMTKVLTEAASLTDGQIIISWTGGEPLLMGLEFFGAAMAVQTALGRERFTNIVQSNLILLNEGYTGFFADNGFSVRTSLDLPPDNHEALRLDGDFARSMASIARLKKAGVPINVNTVVTGRNVGRTAEIYAFLKQRDINSFSVSRLVEQANAADHPELFLGSNEAFGEFLVQLFDLWVADWPEPSVQRITPLDKLMAACRRGSRDEGSKCFHCQSQMFAVDPRGRVFPSCNKFIALPETCFGNINEAPLTTLLGSAARRQFLTSTGDVSGRVCGMCEFVDLCEGGCYHIAHTALTRGGDVHTRENFCKGYYLVFARILKYLKAGQ